MKKLYEFVLDVIEIVLWGRAMTGEACMRRPSEVLAMTLETVGPIGIGPAQKPLPEISDAQLHEELSGSFGAIQKASV